MTEGAPEGPCPCGRPSALCVCPPAPVVDNRVAVLVLQHPQEQDRVLGTARLLTRSLTDARVSVGLSWRNLGHAFGSRMNNVRSIRVNGECSILGAGKVGDNARRLCKDPLIALDRKGEPLADQAAALAGLQGTRGARRQLGAGQGAVVAQRLADAPAPPGRGAGRPVALRQSSPRGAARRGVDPRGGGAGAVGAAARHDGARASAGAVPRAGQAGKSRGNPRFQAGSSRRADSPYTRRHARPAGSPASRRPAHQSGTVLRRGSARAAPGRRRDLPRRGHPRGHQGDPAVGRGLCRRLPGRARLASGRRAGRIAGPARRARRASGNLHQRSLGRRPAGRLDQLSVTRLRHLEVDRRHQRGGRCALQPRIARRDRRRADRGRRGLRRRAPRSSRNARTPMR